MQRTYYATFESAPYLWDRENLEIEMRIFQIERLDGQEIDFGLGDLSIELGSLIKGSFGIFRSNMASFKNINYSISTLSKPKALLSLNTPLVISIGSDKRDTSPCIAGKKVIEGINSSEVITRNVYSKKQGLFEKMFNFFS